MYLPLPFKYIHGGTEDISPVARNALAVAFFFFLHYHLQEEHTQSFTAVAC
jgi:hypothetical protein